jgi:hypothetical protein
MVHDFRSDGEKQNTSLRLSDDTNPDIAYAEQNAVELITISGGDINVYQRAQNKPDEVWEEDADPVYYPSIPIRGWFVPSPTAMQLTKYGPDIENQTTVVFANRTVRELFGNRMIIEGDVLQLPYNASVRSMGRYRVLNAFDSGNFRYKWMYWSCLVENITDDKRLDIVNP